MHSQIALRPNKRRAREIGEIGEVDQSGSAGTMALWAGLGVLLIGSLALLLDSPPQSVGAHD